MSETTEDSTVQTKIVINMPEGSINDRSYQILREAANKLVLAGNLVEITNMNVTFKLFTEEDQKQV